MGERDITTLSDVRADLALEPQTPAIAVLKHGGGLLFAYRHGYAALGAVLEALPKDQWQKDEAVLGALVQYLVKKGQGHVLLAL